MHAPAPAPARTTPAHVAVVTNTEKAGKKTIRRLERALSEAGVERVTRLSIDKGSHAKQAAKKARKEHADVVLVAGGDGSVRAAAEALVGTPTRLAVVPAGTANLFASAMCLPDDPTGIIELLMSGATRVIDTGVCNGMTFNVMSGAGFDAAMLDDAEPDKERLGTLAYVRAGARQARQRRPFAVRVKIDGALAFEGDATGVLIGNLGTLKGGVEAFPDASPTDGKLDIGVITAAGLRDWASLMLAAARHRQQLSGHAHLSQGTDVSVQFDTKHRFELDGGVKGRAKRLDLSIRPASLTVCAPPVTAMAGVA